MTMAELLIGRPVIAPSPRSGVRPAVVAADPAVDVLMSARAALKQSVATRTAALSLYGASSRECDRLRELVQRLETRAAAR